MSQLSKAFDAAEEFFDSNPADGVDIAAMRAVAIDGSLVPLAVDVVQRLVSVARQARPVVESGAHQAWASRAAVIAPILARNPPTRLVEKLEALRGEEPPYDGGAAATQAAKAEAIAEARAFFGV